MKLRNGLILVAFLIAGVGCSVPQPIENTVEKTTKTIKRTTRSLTRTITLDDQDLVRKVGIFNFENHSLRQTWEFQKVFHKGLPEYINNSCQGVLIPEQQTDTILSVLK